MWINHWSLWRMYSATPDLRLPSQPQDITATWPVPSYTARWQTGPALAFWRPYANKNLAALITTNHNQWRLKVNGIIINVAQLIWVDVLTEFWIGCQIIFSKWKLIVTRKKYGQEFGVSLNLAALCGRIGHIKWLRPALVTEACVCVNLPELITGHTWRRHITERISVAEEL